MKTSPPKEHPVSHRFPLELVAGVAARLMSGKIANATPRNVPGIEACPEIADLAVRLLDACKTRLDNDRLIELQRREAEEERLNISNEESKDYSFWKKKYPSGIPWTKGLLHITGKRSEAEAVPSFKRWLLHKRILRQPGISEEISDNEPPGPLYGFGVEEEVKKLKSCGFDPEKLIESRREFRNWYQAKGIREVRRRAGRTPKTKS